jgi:enoyl-CoA hydratase/carnithine racemase
MSDALIERLLSVVEGGGPAVAIVFENTSGTFCLGLDPSLCLLESGDDGGERALGALERFARLLRSIEAAPRPVIALVDGAAAGGGVALATAADFVIATPRATFGFPETLLGIVPAIAFPVVARRIGVPHARWMAVSGTTIEAAAARELGLADVVTGDPEAELTRCLRRLSRLDPRAVAAVKTLAAQHEAAPAAYRTAAMETFARLLDSPETQARLRRFADGLAPWPDDERS